MIRQALLRRAPRGQRSAEVHSVPAPIKGWNARDSEAAMHPLDALVLENWWPDTSRVSVRKGAVEHATGLVDAVEALIPYRSPTGEKLFAATSAGIFDVTGTGAVGTAEIACTSGRFRHTLFTVPGGTFILAVNGKDKLRRYDGTSWSEVDSGSTPPISGVPTAELSNVCAFKRRLWFVRNASLSAYFLPVEVIGGALTEFPLGTVFTQGGYLVALSSWTIDGGAGSDDFLVAISSQGEIAVYSGIDPTNAADFKLVGVYSIGRPLGPNCLVKLGGDLLLLTESGLFPLSKAFQSATLTHASAISDKIDAAFSAAAREAGRNYGWAVTVFPAENMLLTNIPRGESTWSEQFVMNTLTGAWAKFTGWNAFCWETHKGRLFFGGAGYVAEALVGNADFTANIRALAQPAFNSFGTREGKFFTLYRPILRVSDKVRVDLGLDVDFEEARLAESQSEGTTPTSLWDSAVWDSSLWSPDSVVEKPWRTAFAGKGFTAALRMRVTAKDVSISWSSTDFVFKVGGIL